MFADSFHGNIVSGDDLAKSIEMIGKVDGLVFMKGWENARGCQIEHHVAQSYGKFIKYE